MRRRKLRVLTPHQQSEVNSFYKLMAVALARNTDEGVVLARNQYVEATICELQETVPDKQVLLAAWVAWFHNRDKMNTLEQIQWPVTQFQRELDGALAAVEDYCKDAKRRAQLSTGMSNSDPVVIAYRLLQGGGR